MAKYLRTIEMTQGGGFQCFLCGEFLAWVIDQAGLILEAHCAPCGMSMRLVLVDPVAIGSKAGPAYYRPLERKGALRCLNCGRCLADRLEGALFVSTHVCHTCKSRVEITVEPPALATALATGAPPSASDARVCPPATPAFSGRST